MRDASIAFWILIDCHFGDHSNQLQSVYRKLEFYGSTILPKNPAALMDEYQHPPAFQFTVALAAIESQQNDAEIAQKYGVTIEQVQQWKSQLIEDGVNVFNARRSLSHSEEGITQNELAITIAENSTQGFAMMDERGYCIYANTAWLQMTGYTLAEIGSRPLHDLVHHHYPDGRPYPLSECPIDRALPHNFKVRAHEDLFFRKDGSTFPVMCAASPIFKNGRPVATVIEIRDITRQKASDAEFQRIGHRQAFLLRIAETLRVLDQPAEVMAAASRLIGEHFKVSRVGYGEIDAAETVSVDRDWTDGVVQSLAGKSMPLESFGPNIIEEIRNGRTLRLGDIAADPRSAPYTAGYASIGIQSTITIPLLEEAQLTAVLFLHESSPRNWTDEEVGLVEEVARRTWEAVKRSRAEEKLRDETRILELLNQTGTIVSSTLDMQTLLQSITDVATQISGAQFGAFFYTTNNEQGDAYMLYTLSGAPREAFEKFGHPRATPVFGPTFGGEVVRSDDILADPRYGKLSPHYGMPDKHLPVRSYMAIPVTSRSGQVIGAMFFGNEEVGVFSERSERVLVAVAAQAAIAIDNARLYEEAQKAAQDRQSLLSRERTARAAAERLSHMKDEFLAMLAHELRNPLAPIGSAADLLSLAYANEPRVQQSSKVISRQVSHMKRLVDDLLDVSRVTRGLVTLNKSVIDFREVISIAVDQSRTLIEQKRHHLTTELSSDSMPVYGDETRLVQAVANIVNNAAKYTPDAGNINLKLEATQDRLHLSIKDDGLGIAPELLPDIFELFTQGNRTLARSQGGLGLGLALVKKLIELHDGTVTAHSLGIGQGSEFIIALPLASMAMNPVADEIQPHGNAASNHIMNALHLVVVDDNVDAADGLASLLRAQGHTVSVCYTASDALSHAATGAADAFLLDIGLPDMDGYELVQRLRAMPQLAESTFIAVSGYGQTQDKERSKTAGFNHHLVKPVDMVTLNAVLKTIE
jgi:PAS domain S-box-containing protein